MTDNDIARRIEWRSLAIMSLFLSVFLLPCPAISASRMKALEEGKGVPDAGAVDNALRRGQEYLIRMQRLDGSYSRKVNDVTGYTALCALALVKSGVPVDHPVIQKAVNFIDQRETGRTYCLSVIIQFLKEVDPEAYRDKIEEYALRLIDIQLRGLWNYPGGGQDMSNTQYAALGLRAAAESGVEIHRKVWEDLLERVVELAKEDGGWGYHPGRDPTGSMTCAALTCILICREQLSKMGRGVTSARLSDKALEGGLAWLDKYFKVDTNPKPYQKPGACSWHFYYLYGVERTAALCGRKSFGGKNWYNEGAAWLLEHQHGNGNWSTPWGGSEMNTSFAILFLIRATQPSYTRHSIRSRILSGGDEKKDIVIGCNRKNPGQVWIESWSENVADLFGIKGGKTGIHVQKVEYYADDELLAEVTDDPTGGRITRYPYTYHFDRKCTMKLSARVTCATPGGTIIKEYESGKVDLFVHNILDDRDRQAMADLGDNLISGLNPVVEASSEWSGDWRKQRAVDGMQGSSWLSAKAETDGAPWIRIILPKPIKANMLKLTHAIADNLHLNKHGRATRVRILINRGKQKLFADLEPTVGVKYSIPFKKTRVKDLTIEMVDRVKGSQNLAAGFGELELFLVPDKE